MEATEVAKATTRLGDYKAYLPLLVAGIFLLAYATPVILYFRPFGMDVYSHMVYTRDMYASNSLSEFYDRIQYEVQDSELGLGYPFGLWFFGAIVAKVTGVSAFDIVNFLPLFWTAIICGLAYISSRLFIDYDASPWMSVAFMLSMPVVSMTLLSYRTSVFATIFLLVILYLNHKPGIRMRKSIPLTALSVFALCISHTGTYIFLITFAFAYVFVKSAVWGILHRKMYALITLLLVFYSLAMNVFPEIQGQYVEKAVYFSEISDIVSSKIGLSFPSDVGSIFYREVFVNKNVIHALMWSALAFGLCKALIHVRQDVLKKARAPEKGFAASIPLLGDLKNISHSVLTTPFWIGPLHTVLSIPGYSRLNVNGKCMLLTSTLVTILPATFYTGATGALREIYYLLIIIPFAASAGFSYLIDASFTRQRQFNALKTGVYRILIGSAIFVVFLGTLIAPIIGGIYYLPSTSGANYEINALTWMRTFNDTEGKTAGFGYRSMIDVYADKSYPWTTAGTETRVFLQDLLNTFFSKNGERYTKGLYYTFRSNYLLSSDRVISNLVSYDASIRKGTPLEYDAPGAVYLDSNTLLNKIYDNDRGFSIYGFIPPLYNTYRLSDDRPKIRFEEDATEVKDAGVTFMVKTGTYTIQLDKKAPGVVQLRNDVIDVLDEGYLKDQVTLNVNGGPYGRLSETYQLSELDYPTVLQGGNEIVYKTYLRDKGGNNLATLTVDYTFYQKAIKKEIILSNDWMSSADDTTITALHYTSHFSPSLPYFTYYPLDGGAVNKTIYPSDDTVRLDGISFNSIYFNNGITGMYYLYGGSTFYPGEIRYKRATAYNYSYASVGQRRDIGPGEAMQITQYITLGDKGAMRDNVGRYSGVKVYPFKDGVIPVVLAGYTEYYDNESIKDGASLSGVLRLNNVTYNEGFNPSRMNVTSPGSLKVGGNILSYDTVYYGGEFDNRSTQTAKFRGLIERRKRYGIGSGGFIPRGLKYNIDTLSLLAANNFTHVIGSPSSGFYDPTYPQDLRGPYVAHLFGNESGLLILPVSVPARNGRQSWGMDAVDDWTSIANVSSERGGMSVIAWTAENFSAAYRGKVVNFTDYAKSAGLTFMSTDEVVRQYLLTRNIDTLVSRTDSTLTISAHNVNRENVSGLTYVVDLPLKGRACGYSAKDANLVRAQQASGSCRTYVSLDLALNETRRFTLS